MVIESDDDLSTVFHSCGFFLSSEGAKNVPGPGHIFSEDGIVGPYHFLVNLYIYRSPSYLATA